MKHVPTNPPREHGAALLEVLVTILLVAFGLLGLAGLISRSYIGEIEATQRAQALMLIQDMIGRIESNRRNASLYFTASAVGGSTQNCTAIVITSSATLVTRDLCDWGNLIAGANERIGGTTTAVLPGASGCVIANDLDTLAAETTGLAVAVAWQANTPTVAPNAATYAALGCGSGVLPDERYRRVVTMPVNIGSLSASAVAP